MKRATFTVLTLLTAAATACAGNAADEAFQTDESALSGATTITNDKPIQNSGGHGATWSTQGDGTLDLTNEFHTAQGTNGRSCATCHLPEGGWSITPAQVEAMFASTGGTHPIFLPADANHPDADVSTVEARRASYSMLRKGLFRRGGAAPATREFDIVAAEDPYGWGSASAQRFSVFRRPLATANFHLAKNVGWDDANTRSGQTTAQGLWAQAENNIRTGQAGAPPTTATVDAIVAYESALSFAQVIVSGVGRLDECGARGGARNLSQQAFVDAPFNLYDGWRAGVASASCSSAARAQIARGQDLFNNKTSATGRTCRGCHNAENNGSNVNGTTFDIGASDPRWAAIDGLPIYTVRNRETGEEIRTTDPGKANRSGKWADMNRFKVPSLRGLTARAPFFHNGVAKTLHDVVHVYEVQLGFDFTPEEEKDLVAFMNAL